MKRLWHKLFFRPTMRIWQYGRVVRCIGCGHCFWFGEVTQNGRARWRNISNS